MEALNQQTPKQLLIAFYGDDFTGSTDAMEALAQAGARTVLFLEPPSPKLLAERFPDVQCVGVAGISRSLGPDAMEQELAPIFEALSRLKPSVLHYKVCSTFDSSPATGSIGKAIELGIAACGERRFVPVIAGVPALGRYTVFGHHFAYSMGEVHRLDRHPVMSRHPVTPMAEADLRLHLAKQIDRKIGHLTVLDLQAKDPKTTWRRLEQEVEQGADIVLFDVLDEAMLGRIGELLWQEANGREKEPAFGLSGQGDADGCSTTSALHGEGPLFAAGSSGVDYALAACWKERGLVHASAVEAAVPADDTGLSSPLLVLSGSCSPVTEAQIHDALQHGFIGVRVPVLELAGSDKATGTQAEERVVAEAAEHLRQGRNVIIYTSLGPQDDNITPLKRQLNNQGIEAKESGRLLGSSLGRIAHRLIASCRLGRVLVAGGDTSGYLVKELGIVAMELKTPLVPGGPLCQVHANEEIFDGLELCLKGGQVGPNDFFRRVAEA